MRSLFLYGAIIVALFMLFQQKASAQANYIQGSIVPFGQDTIKGLIDYQNWEKNPRVIRFKQNANAETVKYTPSQIKFFSAGGDRYYGKVVTVDKSPHKLQNLTYSTKAKNVVDTVFLQLLVDGKAKLRTPDPYIDYQ